MKFAALALSLVLLPACRTRPEGPREPVQAPFAAEGGAEVLDFSAFQERSMTVEEFVRVCQEVSGFNFTYSETTKDAMGATSLRLAGPDRVPLPEFASYLDAQLHGCGFTCARVGPENLRVFLVQPRTM